jgi:hypothetical protein
MSHQPGVSIARSQALHGFGGKRTDRIPALSPACKIWNFGAERLLAGVEKLSLQGVCMADLSIANRASADNRLSAMAGECLNQYSVCVYLCALLSHARL